MSSYDDADADWLAWIRLNPGTDRRRLLVELQDELAERDTALADIVAESVGRLNALAESRAEVARLTDALTKIASLRDDDEARRRAIIEDACARAFGPAGRKAK